jgi:hypothetical protein
MTDLREQILERLVALVAEIPNIRWAQRNNPDIPDDQLPAASVFDGDEESNGAADIGSSRPANRPYVVQMTPEIIIAEQSDEVGSDLATLRRELLKRVLNDAALLASVGPNGAIRYAGCQTDLGLGRSFAGALFARFIFKYPLKIEEL